jgi:GxxExxY protein
MMRDEVTEGVIGAFYEVYNVLGYGFLEKVYEMALALEFSRRGLKFSRQVPIEVCYKGDIVGNYVADFLVEGEVIVEVKAIRELSVCDESQLLNYLRCTGKSVGLLLNFGKKAEVNRKVFETARRDDVYCGDRERLKGVTGEGE